MSVEHMWGFPKTHRIEWHAGIGLLRLELGERERKKMGLGSEEVVVHVDGQIFRLSK